MKLETVYQGWDGYQRSLVLAVKDLSEEQLAFRCHPDTRSVAELTQHIADGRIDWLSRIGAPYAEELRCAIRLRTRGSELADWLEQTFRMVEGILSNWTTDDLKKTFRHTYQGKTYEVSFQWVVWRIMTHDIHHGGQLCELLAMQGVFPLELAWLGGHLTEPPLAS